MCSGSDLHLEARETLDTMWFVRSLEDIKHVELVLSLRLTIRPELFVQAFPGERMGSLYFALVVGTHWILGIDRQGGEWHLHHSMHQMSTNLCRRDSARDRFRRFWQGLKTPCCNTSCCRVLRFPEALVKRFI